MSYVSGVQVEVTALAAAATFSVAGAGGLFGLSAVQPVKRLGPPATALASNPTTTWDREDVRLRKEDTE
jgi:hypothetical protein